MPTWQEIPEDVLYELVSILLETTQCPGWQLSLRLVNHEFNEAVLRAYHLQKRWATTIQHQVYLKKCGVFHLEHHPWLCANRIYYPTLKNIYMVRFLFQSFLARSRGLGDGSESPQLLQRWKIALDILRLEKTPKQLSPDQFQLYSTCSNNPIFSDPITAVLSEAVYSYIELYCMVRLATETLSHPLRLRGEYHRHPTAFWVALSACVLGDLYLFQLYATKTILSFENASPAGPRGEFNAWLTVAIKHKRLCIVRYLVHQYPVNLSGLAQSFNLLEAAIMSGDSEVLQTLLLSTTNQTGLLNRVLSPSRILFAGYSNASEIIRLLVKHFSPISADTRSLLILQSCAVKDVTLLEDFSRSESLFSHRIETVGRMPGYTHFAINGGSVENLRFLLDHGVFNTVPDIFALRLAADHALAVNNIECYRELYQRFGSPDVRAPRSFHYFEYLGSTEHAKSDMEKFICQDPDILHYTLEMVQPSSMQRALYNAIQRLRAENVQFLLQKGTQLFPWSQPNICETCEIKNPFRIEWSVFNRNPTAFLQTQEVLDTFDLPKMELIV